MAALDQPPGEAEPHGRRQAEALDQHHRLTGAPAVVRQADAPAGDEVLAHSRAPVRSTPMGAAYQSAGLTIAPQPRQA